jgi:hypothetical protein
MTVDLLYDASFPLVDGSGRRGVAEPAIKRWLRQLNGAAIPTPEGVSLPPGDAGLSLAHAAWASLREPLVLKAFGPSVASGNEPGGVRTGLSADEVVAAISQMGHELSTRTHGRRGYYVEEQQPAGVELILRVSRRPDGASEVSVDRGTPWSCPISRSDAEQLVAEALTTQPAARAALVELLLAVAGPGTRVKTSVVEALEDGLLELEFDPVVAMPSGVCVLNARMVLAPR